MIIKNILVLLFICVCYAQLRTQRRPKMLSRTSVHRLPVIRPVVSRPAITLPVIRMPVATSPVVSRPVTRPVTGPKPLDEETPTPYSFSYSQSDENGTQWTRSEEGDAHGVIRGSYGYRDPAGVWRQVEYTADENGFRAQVNSNEPGLISHSPANVVYNVVN